MRLVRGCAGAAGAVLLAAFILGGAPARGQDIVTPSQTGDGWEILSMGVDCSLFHLQDSRIKAWGGYGASDLVIKASGTCNVAGLANGPITLSYQWTIPETRIPILVENEFSAIDGVVQGMGRTTIKFANRGDGRFYVGTLDGIANPMTRYFRDGCEFVVGSDGQPDFSPAANTKLPCPAGGLDAVREQWAGTGPAGGPGLSDNLPQVAAADPPPAAPVQTTTGTDLGLPPGTTPDFSAAPVASPAASPSTARAIQPYQPPASSVAPRPISASDPQSVIDYLASKGDAVQLGANAAGAPVLTESRNLYTVFFDCGAGNKQCTAIQFHACYGFFSNPSMERVNEWNRRFAYAKVYLDTNGYVCIDQTVPTGLAGIPRETMDLSFDAFLWFRQHSQEQFN